MQSGGRNPDGLRERSRRSQTRYQRNEATEGIGRYQLVAIFERNRIMTNLTGQDVLLNALTKLSDQFQASMTWTNQATEHEKSLVIGNLNGFCGFLSRSVLPEDFLSQPVEVKSAPSAKDPTDARVRIEQIVTDLRAMKPSREMALAITNLQQAFFWLDEVNRLS